jgi:hypothetical protein
MWRRRFADDRHRRRAAAHRSDGGPRERCGHLVDYRNDGQHRHHGLERGGYRVGIGRHGGILRRFLWLIRIACLLWIIGLGLVGLRLIRLLRLFRGLGVGRSEPHRRIRVGLWLRVGVLWLRVGVLWLRVGVLWLRVG